MKRFLFISLLGLLWIPEAFAQTSTADIKIDYSLPAVNTDGTAIPTTGPNSLSKVRFYLSTSVIPSDVSTLTPTLETTPGTTSTVPFSASVGQTVHVRIQVCNVAGTCSLASNEVTKAITASTPGAPVINTITITVH